MIMATSKLLFLILLIQCILLAECDIFNVNDFGAIGDGVQDDSKAFKDAWDAACQSSVSSPIFLVPQGKTFLLQPLTFNGECNSTNFNFQIDGNIVAPSDPFAWECNDDKQCRQWITFENFDGLFIQGCGTINGRGKKWWALSCQEHKEKEICSRRATGFVIADSENVEISALNFEDSPNVHITFRRSTWIKATNLTIRAPRHSPNTDGINLRQSTNVSIDQTLIQTGDDCISIGGGSSYINISNISCGPGHGISIGSLGKGGKEERVEFVYVSDVVFNRSTNGVRIKSWQGGKGYAGNMRFERITTHAASRPIIIDQYYCPHDHCENQTSAVQISNVAYNQIEGTTDRKIAVQLACSESTPCTNITMKDINLRYAKHEDDTSSYCLSVEGFKNRRVNPNVSCLQQDDNL